MRCDRKGPRGTTCPGILVETIDRLGRVHWTCPRCARLRAGLCADCPRPVRGVIGRSQRCADCAARHRQAYFDWHHRVSYTPVAQPMPYTERGRRGGLVGGKRRARILSRARRVEISRLGGLAKQRNRLARGAAA